MVVIWSNRAKMDLAGIWEYYSPLNVSAAAKMVQHIRASVRLLENNPRMAPVEWQLEGLSKEFRSLVAGHIHKIVYYIDGDKIRITAVWDCRRDPATLRRGAAAVES